MHTHMVMLFSVPPNILKLTDLSFIVVYYIDLSK